MPTLSRVTGNYGLNKRVTVAEQHNNQHFATLDQAMNAALQGFGIAIGDTTLAQQDLAIGRLAQLTPTTVKSGNGYYLLHPKSRQSEAKRFWRNGSSKYKSRTGLVDSIRLITCTQPYYTRPTVTL